MILKYENFEDVRFEFYFANLRLRYISPVTGLEWPRGFQEVKVPIFHDNGTGWW